MVMSPISVLPSDATRLAQVYQNAGSQTSGAEGHFGDRAVTWLADQKAVVTQRASALVEKFRLAYDKGSKSLPNHNAEDVNNAAPLAQVAPNADPQTASTQGRFGDRVVTWLTDQKVAVQQRASALVERFRLAYGNRSEVASGQPAGSTSTGGNVATSVATSAPPIEAPPVLSDADRTKSSTFITSAGYGRLIDFVSGVNKPDDIESRSGIKDKYNDPKFEKLITDFSYELPDEVSKLLLSPDTKNALSESGLNTELLSQISGLKLQLLTRLKMPFEQMCKRENDLPKTTKKFDELKEKEANGTLSAYEKIATFPQAKKDINGENLASDARNLAGTIATNIQECKSVVAALSNSAFLGKLSSSDREQLENLREKVEGWLSHMTDEDGLIQGTLAFARTVWAEPEGTKDALRKWHHDSGAYTKPKVD